MNRRGFISLLAGAAGAPLVPWRGLIEPLISLAPRPRSNLLSAMEGDFDVANLRYGNLCSCKSPWCNRVHYALPLTEQSLEEILVRVGQQEQRWVMRPTNLIVSPEVKLLIDTDPNVRRAAEIVLGRKL